MPFDTGPATPNPHDKLFKAVFSEPENAAACFAGLLPAEVDEDLREVPMTVGEQLIAQGHERGRAEGRAEGYIAAVRALLKLIELRIQIT